MSDAEFRAVMGAFARPSEPLSGSRAISSVAVLGAGPIGRLIACEALAAGKEVSLYSAFAEELTDLKAKGGITVRGAHLVGTYGVGVSVGDSPRVRLNAGIDKAIEGAEVIFVATPATVHETYAHLVADHLRDGQIVVLVPGRFLGAVAFLEALRGHGVSASVKIAELSEAPYLVVARDGQLNVAAVSSSVHLASLPVETGRDVVEAVSQILPHVHSAADPLETTFRSVTGIFYVAPQLLNAATVDSQTPPLLSEVIGPALSRTVLRKLDDERLEVAFRYGIRDIPTAAQWLYEAFGESLDAESRSSDLATALSDLEAFDEVRIGRGGPGLVDEVANSLVPLADAGSRCAVPTPVSDTLISLASCVLDIDVRGLGRTMTSLGIDQILPRDLRRNMPRPQADEQTAKWWTV